MINKVLFLLSFFVACAVSGFAQEEIISLNFKDTDIHIVLQALAEKSGVNIVSTPEVQGTVSIQLKDVPWATALDVLLKTYGFGYEWIGEKIVMVDTMESLSVKREAELAAKAQEPLDTVTYRLKYLNAADVRKVVEPQLTPRGRISVLEVEYQKGWRSRGGMSDAVDSGFERAERMEEDAKPKSKTLVITDTQSNVRSVVRAIDAIDVMPRQILIEARIMEVNRDKLEDFGIDWGTGGDVDGGTLTPVAGSQRGTNTIDQFGVLSSTGQNSPAPFGPRSMLSGTVSASANAFDSGLSLLYQKLTGTQFQILVHALEEEVDANTLSAPRVLTLDGQEAYIMVGLRQPIITSQLTPPSQDSAAVITKDLERYQSLGIELNVLPQICGDGLINMVIYPSVTSSPGNVDAVSIVGSGATAITSTDSYPIILVRETQTQVLVKDGETIVIGGLLKDVTSKGLFKVPLLGDLPVLGKMFRRETEDVEKIDLVIFITARILDPAKQGAMNFPADLGSAFDSYPIQQPLPQNPVQAVEEILAVEVVEEIAVTEDAVETSPVAEEAVDAVDAETAEEEAVVEVDRMSAIPEEATQPLEDDEELVSVPVQIVPAGDAVAGTPETVEEKTASVETADYELYQENKAVLEAADVAIGRADRL